MVTDLGDRTRPRISGILLSQPELPKSGPMFNQAIRFGAKPSANFMNRATQPCRGALLWFHSMFVDAPCLLLGSQWSVLSGSFRRKTVSVRDLSFLGTVSSEN